MNSSNRSCKTLLMLSYKLYSSNSFSLIPDYAKIAMFHLSELVFS